MIRAEATGWFSASARIPYNRVVAFNATHPSRRPLMVPDYYTMLGVDTAADPATIQAALDRCRHQWSSGTRNPKYKHTYQSYLDQIPEIRRRLLADTSACRLRCRAGLRDFGRAGSEAG